jgi:hypothetical protein
LPWVVRRRKRLLRLPPRLNKKLQKQLPLPLRLRLLEVSRKLLKLRLLKLLRLRLRLQKKNSCFTFFNFSIKKGTVCNSFRPFFLAFGSDIFLL